MIVGGVEIPKLFRNRPAFFQFFFALSISFPSLLWTIWRPTKLYDEVIEIDEFGFPLSEVHTCFESGDTFYRMYLILSVAAQFALMTVYSWVTARYSFYYEAVNISRCYSFRIGIFVLSQILFVYKEGLLGENGKVQWLVVNSTYTSILSFIFFAIFAVLPPIIFCLYPILKRALDELASEPINVVIETSRAMKPLSSINTLE